MYRTVNVVSRLGDAEEQPKIYFDRDNSYWPTHLKIDDPFNHNFKIGLIYESDTENKDIPLVVYFKGTHYLLSIAEDVPPGSSGYFAWAAEPPTAREFFEALGETITESTVEQLTWEIGYMVSETEFVRTDSWPTEIYVEVPKIDIVKYAIIGACVIGAAVMFLGIIKR